MLSPMAVKMHHAPRLSFAMVTIIAPKLAYYDLRAMSDDGKRYELIDGEVFMTHLQTGIR